MGQNMTSKMQSASDRDVDLRVSLPVWDKIGIISKVSCFEQIFVLGNSFGRIVALYHTLEDMNASSAVRRHNAGVCNYCIGDLIRNVEASAWLIRRRWLAS